MILGQEIYGLEAILEKYGLVGFLVVIVGVIAFYLVRSLRDMGRATTIQQNRETELEQSLVGLVAQTLTAYAETRLVIDKNSDVVGEATTAIKNLYDSHTTLITELRDVRSEIATNLANIQRQLAEPIASDISIQVIGYNGTIFKGVAKTVTSEDGVPCLIVEIEEHEEVTE